MSEALALTAREFEIFHELERYYINLPESSMRHYAIKQAAQEQEHLKVAEQKKSLRDIVIAGVGYIGAVEVLDLKRRLANGGLVKMFDISVPNWKTTFGAVGAMLSGVSGVLTGVAAIINDAVNGHLLGGLKGNIELIVASSTIFSGGWVALGLGHKLERQIEATKAVAVVTAAANPEVPSVTAADASAAMARIKSASEATSTPVQSEGKS